MIGGRSRALAAAAACAVATLGASAFACRGTVDPGSSGTAILFIGNSLTYWNDLPEIVHAFADSAGIEGVSVASVVEADAALVDHWKDGLAQEEIRSRRWRFVVLQQGPSSVQINRDSLRLLTGMFAAEVSRVGARTALYSVWPHQTRQQDFPRAIESYELAAADVNGVFLPVASAWLAAWQRDPAIELYSDDELHPSVAGSYLAALVMYARFFDRSPVGLPSRLGLRTGTNITVDPGLAAVLQEVAAGVAGGAVR